MAIPERVKTKMKEEGLKGVNKPKKTPNHKTKSHCVMAKEGDTYKFIRFGQQGVKGAGKAPTTAKDKARKKVTTQDMMHKGRQRANCQQNTGPTKSSGRIDIKV